MATNPSLTEEPNAQKTAAPSCFLPRTRSGMRTLCGVKIILTVKVNFMNVSNIYRAKEWFEVLQTTGQSQTAVMRLESNQPSGKKAESHKHSQQLLLLNQGELASRIGRRKPHFASRRRRHHSAGSKTQVYQPRNRDGRYIQRLLSTGISS